MELKRFFRKDGIELVVFPYSNNKRWCIVSFGKCNDILKIFETEKEATSWAQNFIVETEYVNNHSH